MRFLYFLAALGLVMGGGLIHGHWSQRWQTADELREAAAVVPSLPLRLGNWQGSPLPELDQDAEQMVHRRYDNGKQRVTVVLECGRVGRMAAFVPNPYFTTHELADAPVHHTVKVKGRDMEIVTARFRPAAGTGPAMRLFGSWKNGGSWEASTDLRWRHRGKPYLYRFFLAYKIPSNELAQETANTELAAEWLGMIDDALGTKP